MTHISAIAKDIGPAFSGLGRDARLTFKSILEIAKSPITAKKEMVYTPARVLTSHLEISKIEIFKSKNPIIIQVLAQYLFFLSKNCGNTRSRVNLSSNPETPM